MPAVQVRDLDQTTYDALKQEAKQYSRSINKHLEAILVERFEQDRSLHTRELEPANVEHKSTNTCTFANPWKETPATPEEIEKRRQKRERLFREIKSLNLPEIPDELSPEKIVREMRDSR